jgi:hypothetical protein
MGKQARKKQKFLLFTSLCFLLLIALSGINNVSAATSPIEITQIDSEQNRLGPGESTIISVHAKSNADGPMPVFFELSAEPTDSFHCQPIIDFGMFVPGDTFADSFWAEFNVTNNGALSQDTDIVITAHATEEDSTEITSKTFTLTFLANGTTAPAAPTETNLLLIIILFVIVVIVLVLVILIYKRRKEKKKEENTP